MMKPAKSNSYLLVRARRSGDHACCSSTGENTCTSELCHSQLPSFQYETRIHTCSCESWSMSLRRGKSVMLDCGIHPGYSGEHSLPYFDLIDLNEVDVMLITHFHLDHCAAVPYVVGNTTFKVCLSPNIPVCIRYDDHSGDGKEIRGRPGLWKMARGHPQRRILSRYYKFTTDLTPCTATLPSLQDGQGLLSQL